MRTHKNGDFFLRFCTKTEQCERVASMQQKRILTKTEQCEWRLNLLVKAQRRLENFVRKITHL